jgi:CheY-like chemotaxis protein
VTRVLIVDDDASMRMLVRLTLETDPSLEVVGEASDGNEALARTEELSPDLVVMDLTMPIMDGVEATRRIKQTHPATNVVAFSSVIDQRVIDAVVAAGAFTKVDKSEPNRLLEVAHALTTVPAVPAGASVAVVPPRVSVGTMAGRFADTVRMRLQRLRPARSAGALALAGVLPLALWLFIAGIGSDRFPGEVGKRPAAVASTDRALPIIVTLNQEGQETTSTRVGLGKRQPSATESFGVTVRKEVAGEGVNAPLHVADATTPVPGLAFTTSRTFASATPARHSDNKARGRGREKHHSAAAGKGHSRGAPGPAAKRSQEHRLMPTGRARLTAVLSRLESKSVARQGLHKKSVGGAARRK